MGPTKAEIRTQALAARAAVPEDVRETFALRLAAIGPRLVAEFSPRNAGLTVGLFTSIGTEPDLEPLADALAAADVPLALPATRAPGLPLEFRRWSLGEPLVTGRLGIGEPDASHSAVLPDVLFVPLAAFDRRGHRIGYGKGHFDRTLAMLRAVKRIRAIGVGYGVQHVLFIPNEAHDQSLDLVVTERETFVCSA